MEPERQQSPQNTSEPQQYPGYPYPPNQYAQYNQTVDQQIAATQQSYVSTHPPTSSKKKLFGITAIIVAVLVLISGTILALSIPKQQTKTYLHKSKPIVEKLQSEMETVQAKTFNANSVSSTDEVLNKYATELDQLKKSSQTITTLQSQHEKLKKTSAIKDIDSQVQALFADAQEIIRRNQEAIQTRKSVVESLGDINDKLDAFFDYINTNGATVDEGLTKAQEIESDSGTILESLHNIKPDVDQKNYLELEIESFDNVHGSFGQIVTALQNSDFTTYQSVLKTSVDNSKAIAQKIDDDTNDYYINSTLAGQFRSFNRDIKSALSEIAKLQS